MRKWLGISNEHNYKVWTADNGLVLKWGNWVKNRTHNVDTQQGALLRYDGKWEIQNEAESHSILCVLVLERYETTDYKIFPNIPVPHPDLIEHLKGQLFQSDL